MRLVQILGVVFAALLAVPLAAQPYALGHQVMVGYVSPNNTTTWLTVTPGLWIAGRKIPLVPDGLFAAAMTGALGNLWTGWTGMLDANGSAQAVLDLRRFGPAFRGARIWSAAATIDPAAPGPIGVVSKPIVLVLE